MGRKSRAARRNAIRNDSARPASRLDGWQSGLTGLGTGRDRRTSVSFASPHLPYQQLAELYRGDPMASRVVDLLPGEMLRKKFLVSVEDKKEHGETVMDQLDELDAAAKLKQAKCWERAFGGAGILLGANDGATDLTLPLNEAALRSVEWLTVLDSQELRPSAYYDDPRDRQYGEPRAYQVNPLSGGEIRYVHESRVLRFGGVVSTRAEQRANGGWGDSVLLRVHEVLRDFGSAWGGVAHLLSEHGQPALTVPGLAEAAAAGTKGLETRLATLATLRSTLRLLVLDGGGEGTPAESLTHLPTPLAGLAELLDKFALRLAAAARIPVTLLMGQAPAGLNATGDADVRWFYDQVAAAQEQELRPQLNRLVRLLLLAREGPTGGVEPKSWRVIFPPLWELTELEKADLRQKQAQTDVAYVQAGVLDPEEVALSRFGGQEYSTETTLDIETRKAMAPEAEPAEPVAAPVAAPSGGPAAP